MPAANQAVKDAAHLTDVLNAVTKAQSRVRGVTFRKFIQNETISDSVLFQMIAAGEAVKRISKEFLRAHDSLHWDGLTGMRDFLSHRYDAINLKVIWDTVHNNYPDLVILLKRLIGQAKSVDR